MTTPIEEQLEGAFASYTVGDAPAGYATEGTVITNKYGLYAAIYRKKDSKEYMISFRGTQLELSLEGARDWTNNLNRGWPQYDESRERLLLEIERLINEEEASKILLVGHSLGGALAQFAAYDIAVNYQGRLNGNIELTTWNSLGGEWGLRANVDDYDPSKMEGIQATHYFRHDDFVARLGGRHVGGKTVMLLDPRNQFAFVSAAHSDGELRESIDTKYHRLVEPAYISISNLSLQYAGNVTAGALNAIDGEIEGPGLVQLGTSLPTYQNPLVYANVNIDVAKIASCLLTQEAVAAVSQTGHFIAESAKKVVKGIAYSAEAVKAFIAGAIETAIFYRDVSVAYGVEKAREVQTATSQFFNAIGEQLTEVKHELANTARWISQLLMENRYEILEEMIRGAFTSSSPLNRFMPSLLPYLEDLRNQFDEAARRRYADPLILDLDGDGIETIAISNERYFDHDNNGYAEQTAWVSPDDGFLIWDRNQNGAIDSGLELFGNQSPDRDGNQALHGFQALAALDSNTDGRIDDQDAAWSSLSIWQDYNSNAILENRELRTLGQAKIRELRLQFTQGQEIDAQGNQHLQLGSYLKEDGEQHRMNDVWLQSDPARTFDLRTVPISLEIKHLPDIAGMGNVSSLHQAMQRDGTDELRELVEQWTLASDEQRKQLIRPLIYRWTGVIDLPVTSQAFLADARSLAALEALFGVHYRSGAGIQNWQTGQLLERLFENIVTLISGLLDSRKLVDPLLNHVDVSWNEEANAIRWDVSRATAYLLDAGSDRSDINTLRRIKQSLRVYGDTGINILKSFYNYIRNEKDVSLAKLLVLGVDNEIKGSAISEIISGDSSAEFLIGMGGNDVLNGNDGDDVLEGSLGDDVLNGGFGNDTYLFSRGFGNDLIQDIDFNSLNTHSIIFTDIGSEDIKSVERSSNRLMLITRNGDRLIIGNYFISSFPPNASHHFRFADGARWDRTTILERVVISGATSTHDILEGYFGVSNRIDGLGGNDQLYGADLGDRLVGNEGHDHLDGKGGDDILDGGQDNDTLQGGLGNDLYIFSGSFGKDLIRDYDPTSDNYDIAHFGDRQSSEVSAVECWNSALIIRFNTGDELTIDHYFDDWSKSNQIEELRFADGISWDSGSISSRVVIAGATESDDVLGGYLSITNRIDGLAGNDYLCGGNLNDQLMGNTGDDILNGGSGNDILQGGLGNDNLIGGSGSNLYLFTSGDGKDRIQAWDAMASGDLSRLQLQGGIRPIDVNIRQDPNNASLILSMAGSGDQITIKHFFDGENPHNTLNPIHEIVFADGSIWDRAYLTQQAMLGSSANDILKGTVHDDLVRGYAGDDQLFGAAGHDTLIGAEGNDTLWGGTGVDTLQGGSGDNRYFFSKGDGQDTIISDYSFTTTIRSTALVLTGEITSSEIQFLRFSSNLIAKIAGTNDSVTIQNFFRDNNPMNAWNPVMGIYFLADQSLIRADQIPARISNVINGTSSANTLLGTSGVDNILGWAGNDILDGRDGDDYLDGGDGNDTLIGGNGDDQMQGGAGVDAASYAPALGPIKVDLSLSTPQNTGLSGMDTLLMIEDLIGSNGDDDLKGNSGVNRIDGGAGDDWIDGQAGNDNLIGGSHGVAGDTVSYASAMAGVVVNLTSGLASGGGGSDSLNGFENVRGSAFADTLIGTSGNNLLDGADGTDTASYASVSGVLRIDLSNRGPQNTGSAGFDTFLSIENLITGSGADTLLGNAAANRLDGAAGDDTVDGGGGDDVLIGGSHGSSGDTVTYASALTGVTVSLAIGTAQGTSGAGIDTLSGFENLTGSAYNDSLFGSDGANVLNGGAGDDLLWGSPGLDRLIGGAGGDQFVYRSAGEAGIGTTGRDVIQDLQAEDRIDLNRIDANASLTGDQAFVWIGAAGFTAPGQLRYTVTSGIGVLEGNLSGTSGAEFQIALTGGPVLQPSIQLLL